MTAGDDVCVIDTNVLVYSTVSGNPWHEQARHWLAELQSHGIQLCVTTQVLREYLVVLTRGTVFEKSFTVDQVLEHLESLLANITVFDEPLEAAKLLRSLIRQYQVRGKSIHDANVVAVMLTHGAYRLVTYNHADFERFNEIVLEPAPTEKISDAK